MGMYNETVQYVQCVTVYSVTVYSVTVYSVTVYSTYCGVTLRPQAKRNTSSYQTVCVLISLLENLQGLNVDGLKSLSQSH